MNFFCVQGHGGDLSLNCNGHSQRGKSISTIQLVSPVTSHSEQLFCFFKKKDCSSQVNFHSYTHPCYLFSDKTHSCDYSKAILLMSTHWWNVCANTVTQETYLSENNFIHPSHASLPHYASKKAASVVLENGIHHTSWGAVQRFGTILIPSFITLYLVLIPPNSWSKIDWNSPKFLHCSYITKWLVV